MSDYKVNMDFRQLSPQHKTTALLLVAILALIVFLLTNIRIIRVAGSEIGIKINNISGEIEVISDSGTNIYNGLVSSFYLVDTADQRLEMTADPQRGDRRQQDDLRIKTVDGSDVYVDLTINYSVRRDQVNVVAATSGLGDAYKLKWVRDYSRSICRSVFGEMTTEEFYDASIREEIANKAKIELNSRLNPFGIEVLKVIPEKFRFHQEYEEKIRAKKLADQEVEEQISKANAAQQNQIFRVVEGTKKKEVFLASIAGQMEQLIVQANANADKMIKEAEAYAIETKRGAEGKFYEMEQNAKAITAKKKAEAEALAKLAEALEGEGGRNIVKMEYAQRLKNMEVSGQPYSVDNTSERFITTEEAAAANKR